MLPPRSLRFFIYVLSKTFQIALCAYCAFTTFSSCSSRSKKFKSTLSTFSFVLRVFLSDLGFQKVAREDIEKIGSMSQLGPGVYVGVVCMVEAPESQGGRQQDLGCLLLLLRLILLNNTKAANASSRVWLPCYNAHCRRTFLFCVFMIKVETQVKM